MANSKEPRVLAIILGGGKGTRLYPLTKERSKPAVPFGGKYRIVDIPISNCINSGYRKIYLLTQFNSASLHHHITNSYNFDNFSKGFVEILAAEQTLEHSGWFEGTADAVRKNMVHFRSQNPTHYIILSGDQLYRMDLRKFMDSHIKSLAMFSLIYTGNTNLFIKGRAYSVRNTAEKSEMGNAIAIESNVTHTVPNKKGKKPNLPLSGFHSELNRSVHKDSLSRTGFDFRYNPMAIAATITMDNTVNISIMLQAARSFRIRTFISLSFQTLAEFSPRSY